jgi:hypothetical protein
MYDAVHTLPLSQVVAQNSSSSSIAITTNDSGNGMGYGGKFEVTTEQHLVHL